MTRIPDEMAAALRQMRLVDEATPAGEPLTGGVSSDIWRVDLPGGPICVKRALGRLRVTAHWEAPVARSAFEARWMRVAARVAPASVPTILGEAGGCLAMTYLPATTHTLWKSQLARGEADPAFAAAVGDALGRLHAATAADPALADDFASEAIFEAIRLAPYLGAAAAAHPDRAAALHALIDTTRRHRVAMVHGDASPKNILHGPDGPVFLDAECATWGDPAFDLAFCLNHLLLKCVWVPRAAPDFLACYDALATAYLRRVDWEATRAVETRAARLLPGLLLARVDGKSPVEYITAETDRARVRQVGRALLADPADRLAAVRTAWEAG